MSQKEISEILGITQAAVSQYVSNKRGSKIEFQEDVMNAIRDLANDIAAGNRDNQASRICEICIKVREDGTLCGLNCECESGSHGH